MAPDQGGFFTVGLVAGCGATSMHKDAGIMIQIKHLARTPFVPKHAARLDAFIAVTRNQVIEVIAVVFDD